MLGLRRPHRIPFVGAKTVALLLGLVVSVEATLGGCGWQAQLGPGGTVGLRLELPSLIGSRGEASRGEASRGEGSRGEPSSDPILRIEAGTATGSIERIATDAAGRYLVTGSKDKTARVWDLASGRLLRVLRPPIGAEDEGRIGAVAMSPDGSRVACGGWTGFEWDRVNSIYVFDPATGRLVRRISGLPETIQHLAWSPDGMLLAAGLGGGGVRLFRAHDGAQVGADIAYADYSTRLDFHLGGQLVATSLDGLIRRYRASNSGLTLVVKRLAPGGKHPLAARFSPDGTRIAVSYEDSSRVDVLSADTLGHLYSADTRDLARADFGGGVAWSADGQVLYAGGRYDRGGMNIIRVWSQAGRGMPAEWPASRNTITDIVSLARGGIVYSSGGPRWATFDAGGRSGLVQDGAIADLRGSLDGFNVSPDGTAVRFGFELLGRSPARLDLAGRRLVLDAPTDAGLAAPLTSATGLDLRLWKNELQPTLNGRPLALRPYEVSRSVAIAPDRQSFVLGAEWGLRRFDGHGKELWLTPVPGTAWGVNVSGDGKLAIAALGDGTIRWYRMGDGKELLAFFPHADRKRWVLWTPAGYYDSSAGGEDLIGWHLNRGKDAAADFYPASRFRGTFYRPDVVAKILGAQDEATALRLANDEAGRKTQIVEVAKALPPVVEIAAPPDGTRAAGPEVRVSLRVRTATDAPVTGIRARVNGQPTDVRGSRDVVTAPMGDVREVAVSIPPEDSEIMFFAENRHGVSVPAALRVTWAGTPPAVATAPGADFVVKPKLYVLAVGVSDYQKREWKLQYAAKDASDFVQAMLGQKGALYRDVEVKVLTDAQATRDEVVDGLDWLQRQVTAKDVGMLFLAGHGVNDPTGAYYYLPVNADLDKLKRTGVSFSDIKNTLSALAGKALFFIDTCHSGDVMGRRRAGPADITAVVNELASAENGVVVFASSTGRQYSLESDEWRNGAFTKALVEGVTGKADLRQTGRVTHKMLDFYVSERVKELTKGQQTPVNPSPHGVPDFPIALVRR